LRLALGGPDVDAAGAVELDRDIVELRESRRGGTMSEKTITPDEAFMLVNDHIGEEIEVSLSVNLPLDVTGFPHGSLSHGVLGFTGELSRVDPTGTEVSSPTARDFGASLYTVGDQSIHLGFLPGSIRAGPGGLSFALADDVTLSIHWQRDERRR
jgi:hypothetical protein